MKVSFRDRLRAHWRGELSLWLVFFYCPLMVLIPFGIAFFVSMFWNLVLNGPSPNAERWFIGVTVLASEALAVWWCWGTIQKSLNLMSSNRMFLSVFVFCAGFSASMLFVIDVLPLNFSSSIELISQIRNERQERLNSTETWQKKPWTVTAYPELHRLIASGDIGWNSANVLKKAIAENPGLTLVQLESHGGLVHEENLIVDLIQVNNLDTLVLGKCASACTGAFLAGNRRYVGPEAKLGFHQAGYRGRPQDTQWDIPEYESSILYRAKGVAQDFSPEALNASYYSLWKPDVYDVKQSGFATNWWSERPKEFQ